MRLPETLTHVQGPSVSIHFRVSSVPPPSRAGQERRVRGQLHPLAFAQERSRKADRGMRHVLLDRLPEAHPFELSPDFDEFGRALDH
jgi:hypothetical protein